MLLVHDGTSTEQISVEQFAKLMKIPSDIFKKLETQPVFEVNPALTKPDRLNGGVTAPAGRASKPVIKIKIDGIMKTIRYATSEVPDKVNPRISTYEPKRLFFNDRLEIYPDHEVALFMYCLPVCKDSPVAVGDWHYSHQNKEKQAKVITDHAAKVAECWTMINGKEEHGGLSNYQITLVAKGIYAQNREVKTIPNPSAKNKTVAEIRADLTVMAQQNPDLFLSSTDSDVNDFYGMMLDAVDRGIFIVKTADHSKVKTWYWGSGALKDQVITDISGGQNEFDALKAAVEADPNRYYTQLIKAIQDVKGKENLSQFIAKQKAADSTEHKVDGLTSFTMPADFNTSAAEFTALNNGVRPSQKKCGLYWAVLKQVKEGKIAVEDLPLERQKILDMSEE